MALAQMLGCLALLCLALPLISAQGEIDSPCNPASTEAQCEGMPFLSCVPMYNMFANGTCRCRDGTFWHPLERQCRVGANTACQNAPNVPECTPNSRCDIMSNRCTCNDGFYVPSIGSFCVATIGRPCGAATTTNVQCDITKELVCGGPDINNPVCVCAGRDVWSDTRSKCLSTIGTSSPCSVDDDCVENAICTANDFGIARCQCVTGFSADATNRCSIALGGTCDPSGASARKCNTRDNLECSAANSTCVCTEGRVPQGGVCRGVAGHSCAAHTDCAAGSNLLCHQEIKQCFCSQREEMIPLIDRTCGRLGRIGGYCRPGQSDCSVLEYLVCEHEAGTSYGKCGCLSGTTMDGQGRCRRPLGASCAPTNHNCIEGAACIRDTCTCLPGYAPSDDGRCLKSMGEPCNVGPLNLCHRGKGLTCMVGLNTCGCPTGQQWNSELEHCVAMVAGDCDPTAEGDFCVAHSNCTSRGICECLPGYSQYTTYDRRCLPSYGTACDLPGTEGGDLGPCNDQEYLVCTEHEHEKAGTKHIACDCEFPAQQIWDAKMGSCVSLVDGHCGTYLGEHGNRRMQCVESAVCLQDSNHMSKCLCDEGEGMEPDGEGRCTKAAGMDNGARGTSISLESVTIGLAVVLCTFCGSIKY